LVHPGRHVTFRCLSAGVTGSPWFARKQHALQGREDPSIALPVRPAKLVEFDAPTARIQRSATALWPNP
jgi:hypothetical protein